MVRKTTIALIQTKVFQDQNKNIENSLNKIRDAAKHKAKIICLPELFLSPYFCQTENHSRFKLAEKIPGRLTNIYCAIAKELSVILMISLFEKKTSGFYHNTSVVIDENGKIISKYRKMHITDDGGYYEEFYFTPGELGFKSTKTKYGKIGSLICWDQWFPEAARLTTLKGAEILFYPTAIGWHPKEKKKFGKSQLDAWITIQRSHAIANGVFVAAINRIGLETTGKKKIQFWGNSMIIDPSGNIIARSKSDKEEILISNVDLNKIETARNHWPFLRDRRIDYYKGLLKNPKDE